MSSINFLVRGLFSIQFSHEESGTSMSRIRSSLFELKCRIKGSLLVVKPHILSTFVSVYGRQAAKSYIQSV